MTTYTAISWNTNQFGQKFPDRPLSMCEIMGQGANEKKTVNFLHVLLVPHRCLVESAHFSWCLKA